MAERIGGAGAPPRAPNTEAAPVRALPVEVAPSVAEVAPVAPVAPVATPVARAPSRRAVRAAVGGEGDLGARDLRTFNRMLRGELGVEQGMTAIAHSGGWPIRTPNGFIFAHPEAGLESAAIAGEHTGWRPVELRREGGLFWLQLPVPDQLPARYKLVLPGGNYVADPWARVFGHDDHGEYSRTHAEGAHLERWPRMTDGIVEPRAIRVFLPAEPPTHHLYAHDGQTLFDPAGPHGGWRLDERVGPRTLVIGIDNTPARRDEYTHTRDLVRGEEVGGKAPQYVRFVEETLRPFIEARYGAPEKVGMIGASLGGLVSYYHATVYPDAYDFIGGMSATMGWGKIGAQGPTMAELFRDRPRTKTVFYLDSGGQPAGKDNYDSNRAMADTLAALGYEWNRELFHWHEPNAEHTERAWSERVLRPLAIFEAME